MKNKILLLIILSFIKIHAQDISLLDQFGGRLDFTMLGNTLNKEENGANGICEINTSSSAELNLNADDKIKAAYLYWAGSGEADFNVKLNDSLITSGRIFRDTLQTRGLHFFSAFADVSKQVKAEGNGNYTLSDLDIRNDISPFCPNGTNFAGWSILVVYQNENLPQNQINIYDGLQHVPSELNITLNNLNVIDNEDAKIGFLAWEGDAGLSVNESLLINGNLISNPPLNPGNNAFNGTNSFTGENNLYNMDMDFYNIQNNISPGDTSATVKLTSGQDFVMINTVVTKLNSQLPDATVEINNIEVVNCNDRILDIDFTVHNKNSTELLPVNTEVSVYINNILFDTILTPNDIAINGFIEFTSTINLPLEILPELEVLIVVDNIELVLEINDNNNTVNEDFLFPLPPETIELKSISTCNLGFKKGEYNFTETIKFLDDNYEDNIEFSFYNSIEDLVNDFNEINTQLPYINTKHPEKIFIKTLNTTTGCYSINTLNLLIENCPPTVYNLFSPNGDGVNDSFEIIGLENIFIDYKIFIYNRWGNLVYKGNNNKPLWRGTLLDTNKTVPVATYYYVLYLNDEILTQPITGWVYVSR